MAPKIRSSHLLCAIALVLFVFGAIFIHSQKRSLEVPPDALWETPSNMGGMLGFRPGGDQCLSRTQHHLYPGSRNYKPSAYLVSKLREYELLHQRCAKEAGNFSQILAAGGTSNSSSPCQFVVWVNYQGMGNKMLTLTSAFLYALMTERVLLVDRGTDMPELFCEPFPDTSWFLPKSFPNEYLRTLSENPPNRFGSLLEAAGSCEAARNVSSLPKILYVHEAHNSGDEDKRFFCEREQALVRAQVPWIFMRLDVYFVPQMYLVPSFREELRKLFPDPETVFRYTARYLFHPSNKIWSWTTTFYDTYLSKRRNPGDKLVGLQVRPFDFSRESIQLYSDQVMDCVLQEGILPDVIHQKSNKKWKASRKELRLGIPPPADIRVLVTSLQLEHYDRIKDFYLRNPSVNNSRVQVHFVSHEGYQQTDASDHDHKVLMEIYLLTMCDDLVTSPRSTFGYIANSLAGLKPWTLRGPFTLAPWNIAAPPLNDHKACHRMVSAEPCYILGPVYDCDCKGDKPMPPEVQRCQDFPPGLKLANLFQG